MHLRAVTEEKAETEIPSPIPTFGRGRRPQPTPSSDVCCFVVVVNSSPGGTSTVGLN